MSTLQVKTIIIQLPQVVIPLKMVTTILLSSYTPIEPDTNKLVTGSSYKMTFRYIGSARLLISNSN